MTLINNFLIQFKKIMLHFSSMQQFLHSIQKLFHHFLSIPNHVEKPEPHPPPLPLKTRIAVSLASTLSDTVIRNNGTVNRRLVNFLDLKASANPNPINNVKTFDVTVDHSRNLWFRIFVPTKYSVTVRVKDLSVVVFFHGGGFVFLSPDHISFDAVCRRFARKIPAIVVSVNYRLAPEYRCPVQYDDCFDVVKFLDEDTEWRRLVPENVDLSSCFLAGDSAGANIAHHVAKRACEFKFSQVKVVGLVSIQPFFGGEERTESEKRMVGSYLISVARTDWMWKAFLPEEGGVEMNRDHEVINVSGPRAVDLSVLDFPATMLVVGGLDPLQDWQRRYYHWLIRCGKEAYLFEYPTMIHAFYVFPELPQSAELICQIADFIQKHRQGSINH